MKIKMKTGFKQGLQKSIAVEIGNEWLKVIECGSSAKEAAVTKIYLKKLVEIKEPLTDALVKVFKDLKLGKRGVIVCIPRHLVTVRVLEFPSINPQDIKDMVSLQVGKQTPYSREEIIFTYKTLGVVKEGYTKVMLVIIRGNLVNTRVDVLQKAGIEVGRVAMSSEGLFKWFHYSYSGDVAPAKDRPSDEAKPEGHAVILIDVDSNYSDFLVMNNEKLVYTRNFLIGVNHLLENEERWKEKFIEEVIHSVGLYQNEERNVKFAKAFLSGAVQHLGDMDSLLGTRLNLPVIKTAATHKIHVRQEAEWERHEECDRVSVCPLMGMSLNPKDLEIDLCSSELRIKNDVEGKRKQMMATGVLALLGITILSILFFLVYFNKSFYLAELNRTKSKIEKDAREVERMRMFIDLVEKRLDARRRSINVIHEINRLTPPEIHFTNIDIEEGKQTVLQGRAAAMSDVFEFVTTLENSPHFINVKTTYTTTKKEKDGEYSKFEIVCMHEGEED
jgi:Tfp pilus assembly PilM family ATPase